MTVPPFDLSVGAYRSDGVVMLRARNAAGPDSIECELAPTGADEVADAIEQAIAHVNRGAAVEFAARAVTAHDGISPGVSVSVDPKAASVRILIVNRAMVQMPLSVERAAEVASWLRGAAARVRADVAEAELGRVFGKRPGEP